MKYRFSFLTTLLTMTTISWTAETPEHNGALSVDEQRQLMQEAAQTCNKHCSVWSDITRDCFSKCIRSHALQAEIDAWQRATIHCSAYSLPTPKAEDVSWKRCKKANVTKSRQRRRRKKSGKNAGASIPFKGF